MKRGSIGLRLKSLREQRGLSARDVAIQIGVAESTYRDWEYGRAIKGEPYIALAKIFGVTLSELLAVDISDEKAYVLSRLKTMEALLKEIRVVL